MTLPELLATLTEETVSLQMAQDFGNFMRCNYKGMKMYKFNDENGETYVVIKWPHKVPELKVI